MPQVTVDGLVNTIDEATAIATAQWADGAGNATAISAAYDPEIEALTDGLILGVRATTANTTATPTFNPDGLGANTIKKGGGQALLPGDIAGDNAELLLRYNLAGTYWELLNPYRTPAASASYAAAAGTAQAITGAFTPPRLTIEDGLLLRVRAASANTATAPTFAPDGLTARTIVLADGAALQVGDIRANQDLLLEYDLANTRWKLLNPARGSVLYKVLVADETGANSSTAQPWFPANGAVTLAVGVYEFEGYLRTSRSAGTTSHTTGVLLAGTATITPVEVYAQAKEGDANDLQDVSSIAIAAATEVVVKAASTSATEQTMIRVVGTLTVTVAGTLIPQFKYSAAPGGVPTVKAGSFFKLTPRANPSGTWA